MFNLEEQGGEAKAVGWISMSDMFMLCSIVMLAVAVCFALSLKKTDLSLATVEGDYAAYRNTNALTIDELKAKAVQLTNEAGGYRTQASELDQQLKNLKSQLADSEKQLGLSKNESAKFKSQSEGLAGELGIQATKLNSVQNEFDKFRNINTLTIGELKTEILRLTKEANDSKATVASLHLQLSTVEGKLAESEKQVASLKSDRENLKTESARLATEFGKQKSNFEGALATANADLAELRDKLARVTDDLAKANSYLAKTNADMTRTNKELSKVGGEKDQLLADLNTQKSAYAILQKEENDLKLKLDIAEVDRKKLEAKLAGLTGTIAGLTDEIGELKPQLAKLDSDLTGAKLRIIDLEKAVFEKINRAKLVITIAAQDVPKDYTLELFVTDPLTNECGPFSSVIFNDGDEIGVLQQSVDFKSGKEGSQKAVFYTLRPVTARNEPGRKYTVKAMIRHNGNNENAQLPHPVTVNCSIDLPYSTGPDAHKVAKLEITSPGFINKVRRNGPLTSATPYKNMWPWEPVYHFERTVCDFRIDGDAITSLRSFDKILAELPVMVQAPVSTGRDPQEQKIDSIRNRSGN